MHLVKSFSELECHSTQDKLVFSHVPLAIPWRCSTRYTMEIFHSLYHGDAPILLTTMISPPPVVLICIKIKFTDIYDMVGLYIEDTFFSLSMGQ